MKRYSRDDINSQLSCQREMVAKLRDGWPVGAPMRLFEAHVPALPRVEEDAEPGELPSDTEAASVGC